jgi:probable rRNA maturation factor
MNDDTDNPPEPGPIAVIAACARPVDLPWLRNTLNAALDHVDRPIRSLTVKVVDDATMLKLHQHHRGDASTTDVLTFDASERDGPVDADIVVCADEAARRAAEMGHQLERELLLYALHGVLHCVGFDDRTPDDFDLMHAEEDRILTAVGVGPTFRGSTS